MKVSAQESNLFKNNPRNDIKGGNLNGKKDSPQISVRSIDNPEDLVDIRTRKIEHYKISENNPDRPLVSTKVLDSLSTGMINFNQKERDTIAKILGQRASAVQNGK